MASANPALAEEQALFAGMKRLQREVITVENLRPGVMAQAQRAAGANFATPSVLRSPRGKPSTFGDDDVTDKLPLSGGNLMDDDAYDQFGNQPCPASLRMMVNYCKETIHEKLTVGAISKTKECLRLIYQSRALLDRLLKEVPTLGEFHEGYSRIMDEDTFHSTQRQMLRETEPANSLNNTMLASSGPVPNFGRRSNNNMSYSANLAQSADGNRLQNALRGVKLLDVETVTPNTPSVNPAKLLTAQLQNYIQEFKKETLSFPTTHFTESSATGKISPRMLVPPSGTASQASKPTLTDTYVALTNGSFGTSDKTPKSTTGKSLSPRTQTDGAPISPTNLGNVTSPSVFSRAGQQQQQHAKTTSQLMPEVSSQELQQFLLWLRQRTERMSSSCQTDETSATMVKGDVHQEALTEIDRLNTECREHLRIRQELTDLNDSLKSAVMSRSAAVGHLRETLFKECSILKQQLFTLSNEFAIAGGNINTVLTNSANYAAYLNSATGPNPGRNRNINTVNNNSVAGGATSVLGNRSEVASRADKSVNNPAGAAGRGSSFRNQRHNTNAGNVSLMNASITPPVTALGDILQQREEGGTVSVGRSNLNQNANRNSTSININVLAGSARSFHNTPGANRSLTNNNNLIALNAFDQSSRGGLLGTNNNTARLSTMTIGAGDRSVNASHLGPNNNLFSGRNSLQSSPQLQQTNVSNPQTPKPPSLVVPFLQQQQQVSNSGPLTSPNAVLAAANQHLQSIPPAERAQFKAQTQHILTQSGGISITTIFSLLDAVLVGVEEGYTLRSGIDGTAMALEVANTSAHSGPWYPPGDIMIASSPQKNSDSRVSSPSTNNLPLNNSGRNSIAASRNNASSSNVGRTISSPNHSLHNTRALSVTGTYQQQQGPLGTSMVATPTSRNSILVAGPLESPQQNQLASSSAQATTALSPQQQPLASAPNPVGGYNNLTGGIPNPLLFADMPERRVVVLQDELRARQSKWKRDLILMKQQQKLAIAKKDGEIKRLLESTNVEKLQDNIIATVTLAKEELMRMRDGVEVTLDNWRQEFQLFSSQISTVTIEMVREVRETRKALGAHRATLDLIRAACELYLPMLQREYVLGVHPCIPAGGMSNNNAALPLTDPLWCHVNAQFGPEVAAELRHDIQRLQQFFLHLQKHSLAIHQQPQVGRPTYGTLMVKLGQQLLLSQSCTQDLAVQIREMLELEQFHSRELSRFTFKLVMVTFKQQTIVTRSKAALADVGLNPALMTALPCAGIVTRLGAKLTSLRNLRAAVIKLRNDNAKKLWDLWFSNGIDIWGGKGYRGMHRRDVGLAAAQLQRHITMHGQLMLGLMAPSLAFVTAPTTNNSDANGSPKGQPNKAASDIDRRRSTAHSSTSSIYASAKGSSGVGTGDATFEAAKANMFRSATKADQ